jgi:hypothetical protein
VIAAVPAVSGIAHYTPRGKPASSTVSAEMQKPQFSKIFPHRQNIPNL